MGDLTSSSNDGGGFRVTFEQSRGVSGLDVLAEHHDAHVKVLAGAGLVSQSKEAQRRPCHLEAEVFDLMTKWIERYRQQAQERYERLDEVLAEMQGEDRINHPDTHPHPQEGAAS